MKNQISITVKEDSTILEVLNAIETESESIKIATVLDSEDKVIGTMTDGDIRRGLLKGLTLDSPIKTIYHKNPTLGNINEPKEKIIQKAISRQLYQIPIVDNNGHLVCIENLSTLLKVKNKRNRVILMAGGLGTRLRPLTESTPKPLLKVGNKPILETIIENFAKYGFINITISVNYKAKMIQDYFGDGSDFGVNIDYIEETQRLGTAGALGLIKDKPKEPFFVMNGDLLTNINFDHMLDFHSHENAIATMGVREYDFQVPYGVIKINGSEITSIEEKPLHKFFVNAGIYTLSPKVFDYIPTNTFFDMPTLFEKLIEFKLKSISFPLHEYWLDIGRISDFEQAQHEYHKIFNE